MREIKFRGKRVDNGEWTYGCLLFHETGCNYILPFDANRIDQVVEVKPETVGQFTGVCDKDNSPIYEDDLLKPVVNTIGGVIENPLVQWDDSGVWWLTEKDGVGSYEYLYCLEPITEIEVIGNIHQNPELL